MWIWKVICRNRASANESRYVTISNARSNRRSVITCQWRDCQRQRTWRKRKAEVATCVRKACAEYWPRCSISVSWRVRPSWYSPFLAGLPWWVSIRPSCTCQVRISKDSLRDIDLVRFLILIPSSCYPLLLGMKVQFISAFFVPAYNLLRSFALNNGGYSLTLLSSLQIAQ